MIFGNKSKFNPLRTNHSSKNTQNFTDKAAAYVLSKVAQMLMPVELRLISLM